MQTPATQNKDWRFTNRVHLITDEAFLWDKIHIDLSTLNPDINTDDKLRRRLFKEWMQTLPKLTKLKKLYLSHKVNQAFFEKICELSQLESLELKWTGIEDLTNIRNLRNLVIFYIGSSSRIVDISPIKELKALNSILLMYLPNLVDFTPLRHLHNLRSLVINGDKYHFKDQLIQSLSFLEELKQLELLDLSCTKVLDNSYQTILQLNNLKDLNISNKLSKELRDRIKKLPNLISGTFVKYDWDNNKWYNDDADKNAS